MSRPPGNFTSAPPKQAKKKRRFDWARVMIPRSYSSVSEECAAIGLLHYFGTGGRVSWVRVKQQSFSRAWKESEKP
jgi:hypothetical protein